MTGLPGTVLGIPGYLVGWDCVCGVTTRDYPRYLGIFTMGFHARQDYPGLSWVYQDTEYVAVHGIPSGTVLGILGYLVSWDT